MPIHLIAAVDQKMGIGYKNELLCRLPDDLKKFRELTTNNFVVLGRNTYESIGKPLPNRHNLVLSRDVHYNPHPEVNVYHSTKDILFDYEHHAEKQVELFVVGGANVYKQFLQYADYIHLTEINHTFPKCDSHFPTFDRSDFNLIDEQFHSEDKKHPHSFVYRLYERKK